MTHAHEETSFLRRILPPIVVAFLFFAPQFVAVAGPRNRYFLFWGHADTVSLCAAVLLLSAAFLGIGFLIERFGGPGLRGFKDQAFALMFILAIMVNLPRLVLAPLLFGFLRTHRDVTIVVLELALALMVGGWVWLIVFRREILPRAARVAGLILSPLVPIVIVQAFLYDSYAVVRDPLPALPAASRPAGSAPAPGATPIVVILFDEWSYERSTSGGDFLEELSALRALRAESFFFSHAIAPSTTTHISVPRFLFQTGDYRSLPGVLYSWRDFPEMTEARTEVITPSPAPGTGPPTLFAEPRREGYRAQVLGFYLPYRRILGDQVDLVRTWSDYPRGDDFVPRLFYNVAQTPQYWRLPGVSTLWKHAYARVFSQHWRRLNEMMLSDFEALVRSSDPRTFLFFHCPVPHAPFVYNADGTYRGPFPVGSRMEEDIDVDVMAGTPDDYRRSLGHLDRVVDRVVRTLKDAGWYDRALLVMTSDHAWRNDPNLLTTIDHPGVRHVPLLIKVPGQRTPGTVDSPVELNRLGPLFETAVRGALDPEGAAHIVEQAQSASNRGN